MCIDSDDKKNLDFAQRHTTPVVTYTLGSDGQTRPIGRGTGVCIKWHGRHYVLTNTHVMENFYCCKNGGHEVSIQIKGAEAAQGVEEHNGYLLMPQKVTEIGGVVSEYDHKDIGVIELKPEFLEKIEKDFIPESRIRRSVVPVGQEIFLKGFPSKSAEFLRFGTKALFGWWAEFREVAASHDRLVITGDTAVRTYRDSTFQEDGQDLHGISGCGVFSEGELCGLVWGGVDGTTDSALWIVPSTVVIEVLEAYESRQYPDGI